MIGTIFIAVTGYGTSVGLWAIGVLFVFAALWSAQRETKPAADCATALILGLLLCTMGVVLASYVADWTRL